MKKLLLTTCILSFAFSLTQSIAADISNKEYTEEGGYFSEDAYGSEIYVHTDGGRYYHYLDPSTNTVSLEFKSSTNDSITVPSTVDGYKVSSLNGFDGNKTSLKSLTVPGTISLIRDFAGYDTLETLTLNGVQSIDRDAFSGCDSLKNVTLSEGVLTIGRSCFYNTPIEHITIPASVTTIDEYAFNGTSLKSVTFKGTPSFIGESAFRADHLADVNGLSDDAVIKFWMSFNSTPWQESLLDDENPFLIDKSGKLVAYIGSETEIEIPDNVRVIGERAFANKSISSITIPDSVIKIEDNAFYHCIELRSVTIPASVTQIGHMAFSDCYRLKYVTFEYSDTMLTLGSSAFALTIVSPETLTTNDRRYSNKDTAFKNTYFDENYVPVSENGVYYDEDYVEPSESPAPSASPDPEASPSPSASPSAQPSAAPETPGTLDVSLNGGDISISINGTPVVFPDGKPFIDNNDRTQVPVRAVAEALQCNVDWNAETQTVTITKDNDLIVLIIGSKTMQSGKEIITMDTEAQIVNDRTYIPVRFVGEALGMTVSWES